MKNMFEIKHCGKNGESVDIGSDRFWEHMKKVTESVIKKLLGLR